jgi:hypothetical protein
MKLSKMIFACLILLTGNLAFAVPSDPDGIGFYADVEGSAQVIDVLPGEEFEVYLLATNISADGGIAGWEMSLWASDNLTVLDWDIPYPHINIGIFPDFAVGIPAPFLLPDPVIPLMAVSLKIQDNSPGQLLIKNASTPPGGSLNNYLPAYCNGADFGDLRSLYPSSGDINRPVLRVNGTSAVPSGKYTWGEVKNMFR